VPTVKGLGALEVRRVLKVLVLEVLKVPAVLCRRAGLRGQASR